MKELALKNYLTLIENSLGSTLFRNSYFLDEEGKEQDILEGGDVGCGFYVSAILKLVDKIKTLHGTVDGTVKDLKSSGWQEVPAKELQPGDILVWGPELSPGGSKHRHIGFYLGHDLAVSNSSENKFPIRHHFNYHGNRGILQVLRNQWVR